MADHVRETFKWHLRATSHPPRPLPEDYRDLCPGFILSDAEEAAHDFNILEIVQATFYAMVVNDAVELFVMSRDMARALNAKQADDYVRETFKWHLRGEESTRDFRIPEISYAVFYAMVVNDAFELGVMNRELAEHLKSSLEGLQWTSEEAGSTSTSSSTRGEESSSSSSHSSASHSRRGRAQRKPVPKVVAKGIVYAGAPARSDPQDGLSTYFSNPKVILSLKRQVLEEKYLLPTGYKFIIPDADATVNKPPSKCIAIYWAAFSYDVRIPLHPVIVEILNKYELAPTQIVPTSWHNICSFIIMCELHWLTCLGYAFGLVHMVQRAPSETKDLSWYYSNNRKGYMIAIEKKSKVKNWKYDFLFARREAGWGDFLD
ncbi:hypothetical protein Cgig2_015852 [Carnegiea gigantea]|uniref:Transposase (putative) gypsy type domain-containing protein n=1 Tax=Carnegiea gigantea TaxID=171969 RepID=A0A9Q1GRC2_9CARY|nr:hypothetical protein Cgig2_015852 [Carnegiea gigantea]